MISPFIELRLSQQRKKNKHHKCIGINKLALIIKRQRYVFKSL